MQTTPTPNVDPDEQARRLVRQASFVSAVSKAIKEVGNLFDQPDSAGGLSQSEVEVLREGGVEIGEARRAAVDASIAQFAVLINSSITVAQAASRLGVDAGRVRQRLGERSLFGLKLGSNEWHLPAFQFEQLGGEVPHLGQVLRRLPPDLHPIELVTWLTSPDAELQVEEEAVTPLEWLKSGGDPAPVLQIAGHLTENI